MSTQDKYEEKLKNIKALISAWTQPKQFVGAEESLIGIINYLLKHYDTKPELTKGMWVKSNRGIDEESKNELLCFLRKDGRESSRVLMLNGREKPHDFRPLTPHTFTEPDLKLLDTEGNIFELTQDGVGYWWAECLDKEKSVDYTCRCGKTADEAIRNAFNSVLAENLRLLAVSE